MIRAGGLQVQVLSLRPILSGIALEFRGLMGLAKREFEEYEEKRQVAINIAVEAGVLEPCQFHDDTLLEGGSDIEDAYKLGNFKWSKGELSNAFESRREMTDIIKSVVEEHWAGECPSCRRWREDD